MSADRLREAAAVLRERAEAATPGPWEADGGEISQHWSRPEPWQPVASGEVACMAYCYGGSARGIDRDEDAAYIAMMHPPVALALADWLDVAGADEWAHGPHCLTPCYDCDDDPRAPHIRSALAVADAILGSDDA